MSDDGRPTKQRKLSHDALLTDSAVQAPAQTEPQPENSTVDSPTAAAAAAAAAASTVPPTDADSKPLSKNQLKKLRKKEAWEAGRDYRKAKRKVKIKEKKARRRQQTQDAPSTETALQRRRRRQLVPMCIAIDCQFDDYMVEKEIMSLGSQVTRSYSDNSRSPFQAHLAVTSWSGRLRERFEGVLRNTHKNWRGIRFEEDDWVAVGTKMAGIMRGHKGGRLVGQFEQFAEKEQQQTTPIQTEGDQSEWTLPNHDAETGAPPNDTSTVPNSENQNGHNKPEPAQTTEPPQNTNEPSQTAPVNEIVYLTSDSPYTLTNLSPYTTYVIGGIVDKNRHKGLCFRVAMDAASTQQASETTKTPAPVKITTAKLPISEYLEMSTRQVLATNHVVEIMLKWLEYGDWGRAFIEVVPGRKGGKLRQHVNGDAEAGTPTPDADQDAHEGDDDDDEASSRDVESDSDENDDDEDDADVQERTTETNI